MALAARFKKAAQSRLAPVLLAALVGAAVFLLLYGTVPLDVTNDAWIMAGYDEQDIMEHYAGWLAYRASPWRFPLGLAEKMGVGDGTIISYTDSIPWFAILFKLLRGILPATFQYFGLYSLLCYMLQGAAGYLLVQYKTGSRAYALIGSVFFSFSPILIERALRHTALASHWLILFSLLVYLMHRDRPRAASWGWLTLLEVLAIGIHPYFLPMVVCFSVLCLLADLGRRRYGAIAALLGQQAATWLAGVVLGVLGRGTNVSRSGFGFYSMNLNAPFNPTSRGGYSWSRLLPVLPQTLGNYDGFNYLGLGMLLLMALAAALCLGRLAKKGPDRWGALARALRKNGWLLAACLGLALYALSNVVTWGGDVLLEYPLPEQVLLLCNIFRASGRMFYPVYYLLFLAALCLLWRFWPALAGRRGVCIACGLLCAVQLWDMGGMAAQKRDRMRQNAACESILTEPALREAAGAGSCLIWDDSSGPEMRYYSIWGLKNGLDLYFSVANNGSFENCARISDGMVETILQTHELGDAVILTRSQERSEEYLACPNVKILARSDGLYMVYASPVPAGPERSDDP